MAVRKTAIEVVLRAAGTQLHCLVVVGNRAVVIACVVVGIAARVVRGGVARVEPDRLPVIGNRPVVLPFAPIGQAAVVIRVGIGWLQPDGLFVILNRPIVAPLAVVREAAVDVRVGFGRVQPQRLVIIQNGALVILFREISDAAVVKRGRQILGGFLAGLDEGSAAADGQIRVRILASGPFLIARLREGGRCGCQPDDERDTNASTHGPSGQ